MAKKKATVRVTEESESGRNKRFEVTATGEQMTRAGFVREIEKGRFDEYYVKKVNGVKTPAAKPDKNKSNNLG